jgi:hypothetical protein
LEFQQIKFSTTFAGVSRKDRIANDIVVIQFGKTSIVKDNEVHKLQWRCHVLRMDRYLSKYHITVDPKRGEMLEDQSGNGQTNFESRNGS